MPYVENDELVEIDSETEPETEPEIEKSVENLVAGRSLC
jgi:hypothetical protein